MKVIFEIYFYGMITYIYSVVQCTLVKFLRKQLLSGIEMMKAGRSVGEISEIQIQNVS